MNPENALPLLGEFIKPVDAEEILLLEAVGRISYHDVAAALDQPPFDRSPLDGYAVKAAAFSSVAQQESIALRVTQVVYAGDAPPHALLPGEAAQVATGAQLPFGTDYVVKQEHTKRENELVHICTCAGAAKNIVYRGEDVRHGEVLARQGQVLESAHIGLLAGQGFSKATVYRKPRLGLLATGSELAPANTDLLPGKIYSSNDLMLAARIQVLGATPVIHHAVEDNSTAIQNAISTLLQDTDMVITTGGVSVGEKDLLPQVGLLLGAETLFHRLPYRPGGAVLAMHKGGKLIICLSGNPFAALTSFELLAAPCLRKLAGIRDYLPRRCTGILQQDFTKINPVRRFVRARIENGLVFLNHGNHSSGSLSALPGCNCLLDIPAGSGKLPKGAVVQVIMFRGGCLI